ncbi:MAG: DNA-directed RNA polymerase subunit A'' [Candidatus Aenigmatarchaeota archaeon]
MMISKKIMDEFEEYCKKNGITGKQKEAKMKKLDEALMKYIYEPGEAIGIVAAQSISEPATQMTMRSYILASQSDRLSKVTQGLPRLIEIFDARKTFEKNMMIYLKDQYNTREKAKEIASHIKEKKISDIIVSDSIDIVNMTVEFELERESDKERLKEMLKKPKDIKISFREKTVVIKLEKGDIKSLRRLRDKIKKLHVDGIKSISDVIVVKEEEDWIIQTSGSNMKDALQLEGVDISRTSSNDIHQVFEVFGIEAARNAILHEAKKTLDEQGLEVDMRHLLLLADIMTIDGVVHDIGRYGVSGKKKSVLARANFEETKKHMINASFYGEKDTLEGVIENVIVGQLAPIGTGMVELAVDIKKMKAGVGQ